MKLLLTIYIIALSAPVLPAQDQSAFERGDLVRMKSQTPAYVLHVIAVPGDQVRMDESGIYVNEVAVAGLSSELIENNPGVEKTMPTGHYYVVGERRILSEEGESLSQTYNFTPGQNLEKAQR